MSVFHVFKIVQMVPNPANHHRDHHISRISKTASNELHSHATWIYILKEEYFLIHTFYLNLITASLYR